ncbi:MAG: dihydrolipoyllysine-residue succinyltransferase, partial [Phycisphaerales bacterium]
TNGAAKPEPVAAAAPAATSAAPAHAGSDADHRATPLARKLAAELNVDINAVHGTGASGKVREEDVRAFADAHKGVGAATTVAPTPKSAATPAPKPPPAIPAGPAPAGATRERMSPLRQRIASRLVEAQHTAAMLTTFNEVDMGAVMDLRKQYKEEFEKKHAIGLGFMGFFVKAACAALKAFPLVNAYIVQGDDGHPAIEKHGSCDVAVAVSTPKGLVVPVIRNAETLSFADIEKSIKDVAGRARDGKLTLEDMQGGTFTITNGGIFGSLMSTPILNPPQSAILGMHTIKSRPIEYPPASGQIALRPMMYLALSYDHRIVDGSEAVQFLVRIKQAIEDPQRLLLQL